jgi:hypothetical protein
MISTIKGLDEKIGECRKRTKATFQDNYCLDIMDVEEAFITGHSNYTYAKNMGDNLNHQYFWQELHIMSEYIESIDSDDYVTINFYPTPMMVIKENNK